MIKQDDFASPYSSESELNLAEIIKQIERISQQQPVVVLFDEIDSYIFSRDGFALQQHKVDLVNAFLQHLETLNRNHNVIIFGTTNRYGSLDSAAIRPGRFNYHYQVDYPSKTLISAYLDQKLPFLVFVDQVSKKKIIEKVIKENNFSYAYLGLLVNQILESYIKTGKRISSDDVFQANAKIPLAERVRKVKEKLLHFFNNNAVKRTMIEAGILGTTGLLVLFLWESVGTRLLQYYRN
jgi:SpoVK/Ycf46/Vps4 family AAA+-type ATPase